MTAENRVVVTAAARSSFKVWLPLILSLFFCGCVFGQHQEINRPTLITGASSTNDARALVAEMLAQRPDKSTTNTGQIRIRERGGKEREVPVRFAIVATPTNWLSIYESLESNGQTGAAAASAEIPGPGPQSRNPIRQMAASPLAASIAGSRCSFSSLRRVQRFRSGSARRRCG